MAKKKNRYQEMEQYMMYIIIANAILFILYLIVAANGIVWLKATLAIISILMSGSILGYLYLTKELLNPRSLWMSTAAAAIAVSLLFSLILNFPRPRYILPDTTVTTSQE